MNCIISRMEINFVSLGKKCTFNLLFPLLCEIVNCCTLNTSSKMLNRLNYVYAAFVYVQAVLLVSVKEKISLIC